jgi:uncharacterized protein (TIGR03437 family)
MELWLAEGNIKLEATPYDGFAFRGWSANGSQLFFAGDYTVRGPVVLTPQFEPAKRVVVVTEPPDLRVLVDRTEIATGVPPNYVPTCGISGIFDFAEGSTHVLGAPSPQVDINGIEWVFDKWSTGGRQNFAYKAENANITETLTAKFIRGIRVSLGVPKGLKLIVDGRDTWPSYNFIWGAGTKHVITAPAEQTYENGRRYVFKGWSTGDRATQELTLSTSDFTGMHIKAEYEVLGMINVQSNVPATVQVGEERCETPCVLHRTTGTQVSISVPKTIPVSEGARFDLQGLNGDGSGVQAATFTADGTFMTATYRPTYRLFASADPPNGADIRMEPASADAFYPANTRVQVFSTSKIGYRFKHWEGYTAGQFSPATVTVSEPLTLRAVLEASPEIAAAGVRNGAGETPVHGVAPGSLVSIFGANLASTTEAGLASPLAQTIADTTVHVPGSILPLLFVSPEQINAQLPYDLPLGTQTLTIKSKGMPDVSTEFEVVRNAPGLITSAVNARPVAVVTRPGGPAVNAQSPVVAGEIINVFGTGFGPHRLPPPEGFAVSESDAYSIADPVQVVVGDEIVAPDYAGSAAGLPGVVVVRFRTPVRVPEHDLLTVKVVVNGAVSNEVVLPTAGAYSISSDIQTDAAAKEEEEK